MDNILNQLVGRETMAGAFRRLSRVIVRKDNSQFNGERGTVVSRRDASNDSNDVILDADVKAGRDASWRFKDSNLDSVKKLR